MPTESPSPWTLTRDMPHAQRGITPGARSSPCNARADGGRIARHLGRGGFGPVSQKRDSPPDSNRVIEPVKDRR